MFVVVNPVGAVHAVLTVPVVNDAVDEYDVAQLAFTFQLYVVDDESPLMEVAVPL